jgi:hypothetical protein
MPLQNRSAPITRNNVPGFSQSRRITKSSVAPIETKHAVMDAVRAKSEADYTKKIQDEQESALHAPSAIVGGNDSGTADTLAKHEQRLKEVERLAHEADQIARDAEFKASQNRAPVDPCAGLTDRSLAQVECYASHRK